MKKFKINYEIVDYFRDNDNYSANVINENDALEGDSIKDIMLRIIELKNSGTFTSEKDRTAMGYGPDCRCLYFGDIIEIKQIHQFDYENMETDYPEYFI